MNSRSSTTRRRKYAAAIFVLAVVLIALSGCTKTVTVTAKYRGIFGWYFVCTGTLPGHCYKGHVWRVTQSEYGRARVGQTYTISIG